MLQKVIFVIIDGWNMHKWAIRWVVIHTNQGKVLFLKCIMMECVSNHLQADFKVQFRRKVRAQFLDLFFRCCCKGWKSPRKKHQSRENMFGWLTFSKSKSKLQIDSYQSIGTYLLWSIHVSKNPFVITSEIRKDMFSNCLTFFKFYFNMTLLLHGFHPMRRKFTPKIWGICGTSSFSGRRSTRGEPRDMPCLPKK